MTQPDNTSWLQDGWKVAQALFGGIVGIVVGIAKRESNRIDKALRSHSDKLDDLQSNRVTREDFDELRESLTATVVNSYERLEKISDRRHEENRGDLSWIRDKMLERWGGK